MEYKIDISITDAQNRLDGGLLAQHLATMLRLVGVEGSVQVEAKLTDAAGTADTSETTAADGNIEAQPDNTLPGLPAPLAALLEKLGANANFMQSPKLQALDPTNGTDQTSQTTEMVNTADEQASVLRAPLVHPDTARRAAEVASFYQGAKLHAVQAAWLEFENQVSGFYEVPLDQWQSMHPVQKQMMIQKIWQSDGMQLDQPVLM